MSKFIRELGKIAVPVTLQSMLQASFSIVDQIMIGQLGAVSIAAVGLGGNYSMIFNVVSGSVGTVAGILIAQFLGAGDKKEAWSSLTLSTVISLCLAGVFLGVSLGATAQILGLYTKDAAIIAEGCVYFKIIAFSFAPMGLSTVLSAWLRCRGHANIPFAASIGAGLSNVVLNYVLIFGKLGLPRLGGIGAGVATGITFWLLLVMFAAVVTKLQPFKQYDVLGLVSPVKQLVAEYLRIGVPMGVAIFMETSIFGVVALFIAKFGTEVIAAHQAALNFSSLIYMFPMSFSLALTIVVGVEYGAKNYQGARDYTALGLEMSLFIAMIYMVLELVAREYIALIYTTNPHVIELVKVFIIYAIMWQGGDAVAAPIQGILRGYKDVNATFWCSMLAYWAICLPVGLLLDYKFNNGAFAYWQSLDIGVICSAVVLSLRLVLLQRRIKEDEE